MAKDEAYKQAEQKIAEALKSGATKLELGGDYKTPDEGKLSELPESLWKCKQLNSLKISYTKLTALPDSFGQLTQLTSLNLSDNQLTALPDSLGQLTQLTSLDLSDNQLMALPDWLALLTQLTSLYLRDNQLTILPASISKLMQLKELYLISNQLNTLPDSLDQLSALQILQLENNRFTNIPECIQYLTNLHQLHLGRNQLLVHPEWLSRLNKLKKLDLGENRLTRLSDTIRYLSNLEILWVDSNQLKVLPESIGQLVKLEEIRCEKNKLTDLPPSLTQLEYLKNLNLDDTPLNPALQSAYEQGLDAVKAYLHSLEGNAEPLYEAKLVLVGEGGVGKTTLLNALMNKGERTPKPDEATTHGVKIDVNAVQVSHPEIEGVNIQLNAWDFGGQEVYRVTHQFFFSRRSLYLLVWEPRRGVQQCQVEDWLNMIRLRVGDEARVIIVSTNSKSGGHIARIDQPVFKQQYGEMIVGFHEVDSLVSDETTGEMVGIAELKKIIAEESIKFNHVGMLFNNDWKAARDELIARPEAHISYSTFTEVCVKHKLSEIDTSTLAAIMNSLGYIVHYSDDEKLHDDVVLKPEWLTKAIGFVLENRETAEREGILPDSELFKVWHDHTFPNEPRYDPKLYPFFLRLMEKYDVSYRLPEGDASLVAQHVPQVRPENLPWLPEEEPKDNQRRLGMVCVMDDAPPGLIPWMIVRTHDYAYPVGKHSLHWQKGMFLRNKNHGEAMLELRGREFHMYSEAVWPDYFMNVLRQTLDKLIKDNWPGLEGRYSFTVPCKNNSCEGRFEIAALHEFLKDGDETIRCQKCRDRQNIIELLYGFEDYDIREQLTEIQQTVELIHTDMGDEFEKLRSQIANNFLNTMKAMASEAKNGPRLFTVEPVDGKWQWINKKYKLHLWCEAEDCQHPVYDGLGVYEFKMTQEWVTQIAPYANFILGVMKTLLPMVAPSVNILFGASTFDQWQYKDHFSLMQKAIKGVLPDGIKVNNPGRLKDGVLTESERSGILALHNFLRKEDPNQEKIGLHLIPTYTGDYAWVCKKHYDLMQPNIPDVIPTPNH